jgi:hypothetical protein
LQMSMRQSIKPGETSWFRHKDFAEMDGAFQGAKNRYDTPTPNGKMSHGRREVVDIDGNVVTRKSDLDPFVTYDEKGYFLSDAESIGRMDIVEFDYRKRIHYVGKENLVHGGHGDQANGQLGRYEKALEVEAKNEIVFGFTRDGFVMAERANTVLARLPLQMENRARAVKDRLMYEINEHLNPKKKPR